MAEGKENNNVIDFTAYRIQRLAETLVAEGDLGNATALYEALDAYTAGLCTVAFIDGNTYITPVGEDEEAEGTNKNNV